LVGELEVAPRTPAVFRSRSRQQESTEKLKGQVEAAATLKPILDAADHWRDKLLKRGTPVSGNVRFAVGIRDRSRDHARG
jgi:hypothetical protein